MNGALYESLFGEQVARVAQHSQAGGMGQGTPAFSTAEYIGERDPRKCSANDWTCNAWRVKGEELCQGHLRGADVDTR